MGMEITSKTENDRQIFRIGDLMFETRAEAVEFIEWIHWLLRRVGARKTDAEIWAGRRQADSDTPAIHDLATSLAYLSFVLTGVGAVDQMHLAMIRRITSALESAAQRQQAEGKEFAAKMDRARRAAAGNKKDDDGTKAATGDVEKTRDYLSSLLEEPPKAKNSGPKG